jgi:hypothetical protein
MTWHAISAWPSGGVLGLAALCASAGALTVRGFNTLRALNPHVAAAAAAASGSRGGSGIDAAPAIVMAKQATALPTGGGTSAVRGGVSAFAFQVRPNIYRSPHQRVQQCDVPCMDTVGLTCVEG